MNQVSERPFTAYVGIDNTAMVGALLRMVTRAAHRAHLEMSTKPGLVLKADAQRIVCDSHKMTGRFRSMWSANFRLIRTRASLP